MTSVQNGGFWNPLTWDCTCFPADGDTVIINHSITLSTGIAFTMGQIRINTGASLSDGAATLSFYINGGSMINNGSLEIDNLLLDAGFIENNGVADMDSVWTRSTVTNTGTMNTNAFAHDELATFNNSGNLFVADNFANQGIFLNAGVLTVGNNCTNCNIQSSNATFDNDGFFCIANDFLNCATDTLRGSGVMYIGGTSTNLGEVEGSLLIHSSTGSFTLNTGTIGSSVTFGTDNCAAGIKDEPTPTEQNWIIYPNPASTVLNSSQINVQYNIYDLSGKKIIAGTTFNGTIHIENLENGTYIIQLVNEFNNSYNQTFIKL